SPQRQITLTEFNPCCIKSPLNRHVLSEDGLLKFQDVLANLPDRCEKLRISPGVGSGHLFRGNSQRLRRKFLTIEPAGVFQESRLSSCSYILADFFNDLLRPE